MSGEIERPAATPSLFTPPAAGEGRRAAQALGEVVDHGAHAGRDLSRFLVDDMDRCRRGLPVRQNHLERPGRDRVVHHVGQHPGDAEAAPGGGDGDIPVVDPEP